MWDHLYVWSICFKEYLHWTWRSGQFLVFLVVSSLPIIFLHLDAKKLGQRKAKNVYHRSLWYHLNESFVVSGDENVFTTRYLLSSPSEITLTAEHYWTVGDPCQCFNTVTTLKSISPKTVLLLHCLIDCLPLLFPPLPYTSTLDHIFRVICAPVLLCLLWNYFTKQRGLYSSQAVMTTDLVLALGGLLWRLSRNGIVSVGLNTRTWYGKTGSQRRVWKDMTLCFTSHNLFHENTGIPRGLH